MELIIGQKMQILFQVDMNADRIGLTKKVTVGICGDAKWLQTNFRKISSNAGNNGREKEKI